MGGCPLIGKHINWEIVFLTIQDTAEKQRRNSQDGPLHCSPLIKVPSATALNRKVSGFTDGTRVVFFSAASTIYYPRFSYRRYLCYRSLMNSVSSANDAASSPNVNVPFSAISRAPRKNAPNAARVNADPTLIRRTPAAARLATVNPLPLPPASTLTARGATAAQTARMASRFGNPGANSTSAPASA